MSEKLLGNLKRGLLFIVSAPSGTGKSTLVDRLVKEFPQAVVRSRSSTTREPRGSEQNGVDYDFLTREAFEKQTDFLERVEIYGHLYGTRRSVVERLLNEGKHVILVIDTQGALKLKKEVEATYIFISPPSFEELERRLKGRHTEDPEAVQKRLEWSKREMQMVSFYDYNIVNDELESAYQIFKSILIAEEHKIHDVNK